MNFKSKYDVSNGKHFVRTRNSTNVLTALCRMQSYRNTQLSNKMVSHVEIKHCSITVTNHFRWCYRLQLVPHINWVKILRVISPNHLSVKEPWRRLTLTLTVGLTTRQHYRHDTAVDDFLTFCLHCAVQNSHLKYNSKSDDCEFQSAASHPCHNNTDVQRSIQFNS